jgi:integrase
VRHTLVLVGNAIREETPKSHQARVVDLDSGTLQKLLAHQARQEGDREDAGGRYRDRDFVVAAADGSPIHPDRLSKLFQQEVKDSGGPRIRLHDLRHTHATIALRANVPVKVISERLGHESPGFTLSQYAHVLPGMQAEAAELVRVMVSGP